MRYRETISALPPYCALWGFWCLNMANSVRYPLPLFWAFPPWITPPPPTKGVSQRYLRDAMKTRQNHPAIHPLSRAGPLSSCGARTSVLPFLLGGFCQPSCQCLSLPGHFSDCACNFVTYVPWSWQGPLDCDISAPSVVDVDQPASAPKAGTPWKIPTKLVTVEPRLKLTNSVILAATVPLSLR